MSKVAVLLNLHWITRFLKREHLEPCSFWLVWMLAGTQGGDGSAPSQLWESSLWHAFYSPGLSSQPVRPGDIAAVHRASFNSTSNSFSNMETTFLFSRIFKSLKVVLPVAGALLTIFVAAKSSEPGDITHRQPSRPRFFFWRMILMILILMVSRKRSRSFPALIQQYTRTKSNYKSFLSLLCKISS